MWYYVKKLEYPINLKCKDLKMAKYLVSQYGGPDGELSAALRYLNQRYTMPTCKAKGLLTDIGTEEMAHVEMIATMIYQLMDNASVEDIKKAEEAEKAYRRGPFTFSSIGVNPGEEIVFVSDPSITATVVDDKHIRIGETVTSLSGAAKSILHKNALQGPKYWSYNGRILDDIRTEKENCN